MWFILIALLIGVFMYALVRGSDIDVNDDEEQLRAIQEWKERKINKDA